MGHADHPAHRRIHWVHPADHRVRDVLIGLTIAAIGALLLFWLPLPTAFSGVFSASSGPGPASAMAYDRSFPTTTVTGTWSTEPPVAIHLVVTSPTGNTVFSGQGPTGSFSFSATHGVYTFSATGSSVPAVVGIRGTAYETPWQWVTGG